MSLTAEQREILLNGPTSPGGHKRAVLKAFDGPCRLLVEWRRHRAELMNSCEAGRRPWGFWMVERRLAQRPAGEAGELRLIKQFDLYRDDAEREFVQKRLAVITAKLRSHFHRRVA